MARKINILLTKTWTEGGWRCGLAPGARPPSSIRDRSYRTSLPSSWVSQGLDQYICRCPGRMAGDIASWSRHTQPSKYPGGPRLREAGSSAGDERLPASSPGVVSLCREGAPLSF
ncbi:hypothetical protein EGK_08484 [Macaca mulatta]|uniref:Uncharacterized protein n=2 Tax=Macaca TaxID=9539 RepID=F7HPL1_MACMU|nr:hypothetical protein EGK_08484 [Macaca mulatta]EHH57928.1 hypothetical protein EGM_07673 [Macaca fascicularis]